ncbi:MAG: hypothetical protein HAW59_03970 [Betaproteobacteria bacterium]|nr:hypothetical protein [Betaproteobacteria bacterium]
MQPPAARRRNAAKKGGFWRGLLLLALGFTGGVGASAYFAAHINKLPLPLGDVPTRAGNLPAAESQQRTHRETLEFHETLRQRRATPAPSPSADQPPETPRRDVYYLQVGAFGRRDAAEQLRGEIALLGGRTSIRADNNGGGKIFRVWMGPYPSKNGAEESRANLALQGYNQVQLLKFSEKPNENEE